jgi:transcription elongation factor GreB
MSAPDDESDDQDGVDPDEAPEEEEEKAPSGTLYITREGSEKLRAELKALLTVERPKVTAEVSAAAALGDRSENAEYIYGKRRLREIDRRLRFLGKRLERLTVVDPGAQAVKDKVFFGAIVSLENEEDGTRVSYQLVGPDETDLKLGRISVDSPMGRALLGKLIGDSVTVNRPRGEVDFSVIGIRYQ